ncbi:MAG: cobyrinate a,c-diamide synthase [Parasporobacterium sp.]|nr:cobyrinate a,c-diamide synthase [Parasporobacterium sp.]
MKTRVPRIVLAGTNSGCGKTTITCALLQALVDRGLKTGSFKCGPDYIDTMFHSRITGSPSSNLDTFFFDENTLNYLLSENGKANEINIIEGVMGFYDGLDMEKSIASTYEAAKLTHSPVVLTVGARGASLSVLAVIQGFLSFLPENQIQGVILNQCTAGTYEMLKNAIIKRFHGKVRPLGFLPSMADCSLESRHLGLVTAAEVADLEKKMKLLSETAQKTLDIEAIINLANEAPDVECEPIEVKTFEKVRIGVAKDKAFCFYYEDSLAMLSRMGAELVPFSPLEDSSLPENLQGLYLGGGYPELYTEKLNANSSMLSDIKSALDKGLPCIAECGGFMYLTEAIAGKPMVGALKGSCGDAGKLVRFGYITLTAEKDNLLGPAGSAIRGHEFHHWDCTEPGGDFTASKLSGKSYSCVIATDTIYAGYPHFHFYANPSFAESFYKACLKFKGEEK